MKKKRHGLMLLRLFRPVGHAGLILLVFRGAILLRQSTDLIPGVQLKIPIIDASETMLFALIAAMVFFFIGLSKEVYELEKPLHSYYKKFLETRFWRVLVMFALAYLGFGYVFVSGLSRFVLLRSSMGFLLLGTLFDWFWNALNTSQEVKNPYKIAVIGQEEALLKDVLEGLDLYDIYAVDHIPACEVPDLSEYTSDIVLAVGDFEKNQLQNLADAARIRGQSFYHISAYLQLEDLVAEPRRLGPVMALSYRESPLEGRRRVIKRIFDIVVSGAALILLFPVLLIVAVGIKLSSPGPILYMHTRTGKNNSPFEFCKFRTMYTHLSVGEKYGGQEALALKKELMESDANVRKGPLQKIEDDPRVTGFGSFLRRTSLDELPNLFNVFSGSMSLVGPRPHEPFEVEKYESWQKRLLSIKPGMTGYAQLFGRDKLPFEEEAKLDLYYIQHWSILLDFYVLVSTVRVVFKGR